jgi:hypothetical protein
VGASEAALLGKLGVKPFKYGLEVLKVFEGGSLFDVAVLDITDEDLMGAVSAGGLGRCHSACGNSCTGFAAGFVARLGGRLLQQLFLGGEAYR